jgi:hypothetical protein
MYVRPITPLLFFGRSIPAIRAMLWFSVYAFFKILLSLTLFELRVLFIDDKNYPFASYYFAVYASFLY